MYKSQGTVVRGLTIVTAVALLASAANAFEMPTMTFPGHGSIGANYMAYQPPKSAWQVSGVKANVFDQCYQPGQPVTLTITLRNTSSQAVSLHGTWHWVWLGDAQAGHTGGVRYVDMGQQAQSPMKPITIAPGKRVLVHLKRSAPQHHGILGLFLVASSQGHQTTRWITNIAVLFATVKGDRPRSMFFGDARGIRLWQKKLEYKTMAKLGVKWTRVGEDWARLEPKPGQFRWKNLDEQMAMLKNNGILALFLGGAAPKWARSYGRLSWPHPHSRKIDATPSPDHYGDWATFWQKVVHRYPKTIQAIEVWNEPWEGGGISDWGGTGAQYRNLQRMAKLGVMRGNPSVLVGGDDSDNNIVDNLMCDPNWTQYTDLATFHGFGMAGSFIQALLPKGMPLWGTEQWYTALSDRTVQWQMLERARGAQKLNLVILGNFFKAGYTSGGYYNPPKQNTPDLVPEPNAMAYNTMAHFLGGMQYVGEISPEHLPYQFLFQRRHNGVKNTSSKAVLVLFGQDIRPSDSMWPQVVTGARATATFQAPAGVTGVFDRFGRPIAPGQNGRYTIPFNTHPIYVTADRVQTLRKIETRLQVKHIIQPMQVAVLDPTRPFDDQPTFTVRVTNVMPVALRASITMAAPKNWQITPSHATRQTIKPGKTASIKCTIQKAGAAPAGVCPLNITVATPVGAAHTLERMQDRDIRVFTPKLDGKVNDWLAAGITPVILRKTTSDRAALAARPWQQLAGGKNGVYGRWALAHDKQYLYLLAQIHSNPRGSLPWDQTRKDWYVLHRGEYAYKVAPRWPFDGENIQLAIDCYPNTSDYLYPMSNPIHRRYPMRHTDYLFGFYQTAQGTPQAWLYRRPGGPFRHRFPFSPMKGIDQGVAPGVKLVVKRNHHTHVTTFEAAIPLDLMTRFNAKPGTIIHGIGIKMTTGRGQMLFSGAGRGADKRDQSVFQPYWKTGYTTDIPWRIGK